MEKSEERRSHYQGHQKAIAFLRKDRVRNDNSLTGFLSRKVILLLTNDVDTALLFV